MNLRGERDSWYTPGRGGEEEGEATTERIETMTLLQEEERGDSDVFPERSRSELEGGNLGWFVGGEESRARGALGASRSGKD